MEVRDGEAATVEKRRHAVSRSPLLASDSRGALFVVAAFFSLPRAHRKSERHFANGLLSYSLTLAQNKSQHAALGDSIWGGPNIVDVRSPSDCVCESAVGAEMRPASAAPHLLEAGGGGGARALHSWVKAASQPARDAPRAFDLAAFCREFFPEIAARHHFVLFLLRGVLDPGYFLFK